jgi:hypothetical protein
VDSFFQSEQAVRKEELANDKLFWVEMTTGTETQLHRLAEIMAGHKIGNELVVGRKISSSLIGLQKSMLGSHQEMAPSSAATELEPTAAMLDGFYEESKKRIVELNQHEALSKKRYAEHQKEDQDRTAAIQSEFQGHGRQHMSAALQANDTALKNHLEDEENFFMKYWGRVRARNHKQYHICLKIQHDLMSRLKSMREAYQQAENTKPDVAVQPEVAAASLIQQQSFVEESLKEIAAMHIDLSSWD